ncbi:MAG: T9SS type A sorting domain-containing protein [Bacteroidetes bacterium]|nr:T9SS type A sorting domain-containing protein [Bacteroidota bacterium]
MKQLFSLAISLFAMTIFTSAQSSNCADSVRTTYNWHEYNGAVDVTVTIDTFDLDSGFVTTCINTGTDLNQMNGFTCSSGFWSKYVYTYDAQNRIIEKKLVTGSANGWKDSLRTTYSYDASTGNLLEESSDMWDGSLWQQLETKQWTFDLNGNILLFTDQQFNSGNINNIQRISWNYSGTTLVSKIKETGSGNLWVNQYQYIFIYGASGRDSLTYLKWDVANNVWDTLGTQAYSPGPDKTATFSVVDTVIVGGLPYLDTYNETIDTLENILSRDELQPDHMSSMGFFYNKTIETYGYFNGLYLNTYSHSSEWFDIGDGELGWYCTGNDLTTSYDSLGYMTQWIQAARCVMPRRYTTTYTYDSEHHLIAETGYLDANVSSDSYFKNIYYTNPTTMYATFNGLVYSDSAQGCQGDVVQPSLMIAGGCGNYHYQWTPATGLSSDTIPNPVITINDSTIYTLNITDDNGNAISLQYKTNPLLQAEISLDTLPCVGCPAIIHCNYTGSNYTYQWYYNGNLIIGGQDSTYEPTQTGYYYVEVRKNFYICISNSDSIYYVSTLGIESLSSADISLHPNPSSGISTLKILFPKKEKCTITINTLSGTRLKNLFGNNDGTKDVSITLDATDYLPGVYFISIATENGVKQLKWVVQR